MYPFCTSRLDTAQDIPDGGFIGIGQLPSSPDDIQDEDVLQAVQAAGGHYSVVA